eukprot:TRINITY_DN64777_c0_g1_i1.p1 TRINITY_DN64777_c0_g1~~TRINITY_DN64777_c0_g1_i1.p1  ORF type:complete len:348 (-),score=58.98 TRINITY_DN64777_c0_g1_i1:97-1140(-)
MAAAVATTPHKLFAPKSPLSLASPVSTTEGSTASTGLLQASWTTTSSSWTGAGGASPSSSKTSLRSPLARFAFLHSLNSMRTDSTENPADHDHPHIRYAVSCGFKAESPAFAPEFAKCRPETRALSRSSKCEPRIQDAFALRRATNKSCTCYSDFGHWAVHGDPEHTRERFRRALVVKYSSVISAWKKVLDPFNFGKLSFGDFCKATRKIGHVVDARLLWEALDVREDGMLTLDEIDPALASLLFEFHSVLQDVCGSAQNAWKRYFASRQCEFGRCAPKRFAQAARNLGYEGPITPIIRALDTENAGIPSEDFAMLDAIFKFRGEPGWEYGRMRSVNSSPTLVKCHL